MGTTEIQIASTAEKKLVVEMTIVELEAQVNDIREVVEWLMRDDASYEERCFAEEVKLTAVVYLNELARRQSS